MSVKFQGASFVLVLYFLGVPSTIGTENSPRFYVIALNGEQEKQQIIWFSFLFKQKKEKNSYSPLVKN